ncbi:MAG: phosphoribosylformylglycinamidine synthase subunit PurL [Chloroflexi bacterium]|nr:phosphoribosylformylglycinamidine synthase subunit PurL [Chloroflexota bacterium]
MALPGETRSDYLLEDIAALGIQGVERVERADLYFLRGRLSASDVALLCDELLVDPVVQRARWGLAEEPVPPVAGAVRVEVGLLQGVTDSVAHNLLARAKLLGVEGLRAAGSATSYLLFGDLTEADVRTIAQRLLYNDVIQYYQIGQLDSHVGKEPPATVLRAERVPISDLDEQALLALSRDRLLSLDLAEMRAVQRYFAQEGREPTDVELESIAQTWSEHCGHKTFKGLVEYRETTDDGTTQEQVDSLIRTYLQAATNQIAAPWVRSAFVDNAGILDFTKDYEVSFKVETHNHPSALEPFGGANTGVGGVVRDIIGVSARPIANTDVLCFGPLDKQMDELPAGVLHPKRIYSGVVAGIEDYGNKMGIPTVNGAIVFEEGYTANPLVYCGCLGIAPINAHPRGANPGDLIVVLGGRTGRDGLHGATFSSIELTDETGKTSGGAVQIGNPITEKMVLDAIMVARDQGLYSAITDCGAGGLSSAVSEMGEDTGLVVQLERVPLKYHGLQPWEIWLSEAQERMVLAVPPENEARLRRICEGYSVEMTVIGTFADDGRLHLRYEDQVVADMSMEFLHKGIPRRLLKGHWQQPHFDEPERPLTTQGADLAQALLRILAHPNVRSKEDVVRRYDHEVQGGTLVKPFVGAQDDGPSDATVLRPLETASEWIGLAVGCGFNPAYGAIDPHAMAVAAIDEAVRNVVAVGADPERIAILDNFCWGNPLLPDRMGSLVRACKGCYDGAMQYGTPFVSGKDSLNNEYTDTVTGQQVAIPGSLLISALGIVPDVRQTCTMDLKEPGNKLYLVGETRRELGGSYYYRLHQLVGHSVPRPAEAGPAIARALHRAIAGGLVRACHDCSEGGLAVAVAEMALAGELGAEVELYAVPTAGDAERAADWLLFAESNARYLVEVKPEQAQALEEMLADVPHACIGQVVRDQALTVRDQGTLFSLPIQALRHAWRGHLTADEEGGR